MGLRYLGNIIKPGYNPLASNITTGVNTAQFQGVFTLQQQARALPNQRWVTDPLYRNTTLLLQADNAANGAQNNTFLDSSSNNFTITRNGNTTQGTFTPYSLQPGAWSNYFNGSSDYLRIADNAAFDFGTGAFCIEMWFMLTADAAQNGETNREATLLAAFPDSGTLATTYAIGIGGNSTTTGTAIAFSIRQSDTIAYNQTYTATITKNVWHHIAVCRSGNDFAMFYDGLRVSSNASYTYTVDTNHSVKIGALIYPTYNHYFPGYISNVRIVKGASVYTPTNTSIVVPNIPLGATSGGQTPPTGTQTSLLTCQSNRFVDNGGLVTPNTITIGGGTPSVQAFSPFAPQYQYTPSVTGGSGYFDGTGDYLSVPSTSNLAFGTGDFCVEFWLYRTGTTGGIFSNSVNSGGGDAQFEIQLNGTNKVVLIGWNTIFMTGATTINTNTWYHIAVVRSGTSMAIFVNGARDATATSSNNFSSTNAFVVGLQAAGSGATTGYISSLRAVKGSFVYNPSSTTVTIPTAPLTAITNTSLLLNFTNAGIVDGTMKNNLETVGNAQISTAVVKYGSGSMAFDGSGDYLKSNVGTSDLYTFGTGDFTIEMWLYLTNVSVAQVIFDTRPASTNGVYPDIYFNNSGSSINWYISSADRITSSSVSINTWYHVAVCRSGTSTKMFINGTQAGSTYTDTNNYLCAAQRPIIGVNATDSSSSPFYGYIDDLRITKGIARYTQNFIPPSVALPRQ